MPRRNPCKGLSHFSDRALLKTTLGLAIASIYGNIDAIEGLDSRDRQALVKDLGLILKNVTSAKGGYTIVPP